MRRLVFAFALIATPALAADPPPTMIMPTPLMNQVLQYMMAKPYAETAGLIAQMQNCGAAQTLDEKGAYPAAAQQACPAVAERVAIEASSRGRTPHPEPTKP